MYDIIKQPYHVTVSRVQYSLQEERIFLKLMEKLQHLFAYNTSVEDFHVLLETRKKAREMLREGKSYKQVRKDLNLSESQLNSLKVTDEDYIINLRVKELIKEGSTTYKAVRFALDSLISKKITIEGVDKKYGRYRLCSSLILEYKYFFDKEFVEIKISNEVLSYLCAALSSYTKYCLNVAFNCSSPYTSRLYRYASHWRDKNDGFITDLKVDKLRGMLCLADKYNRANSIKQIILDPAIRELKAKADVYFDIKKPIKEGRKVVGWKIAIHKKEGTARQIEGKAKKTQRPIPLKQEEAKEEKYVSEEALKESKSNYINAIETNQKRKRYGKNNES